MEELRISTIGVRLCCNRTVVINKGPLGRAALCLFHVERRLVGCDIVPRGTLSYLPNFTSKTFTSAGETPGIRDA